ncbi:MAG: NTP transferase domain-containing protein [Lachnospiraceae bacterium]|nr:NTP transferase domain-containing protein [Lachnospiraceae bacterium]
MNLEFLVTRTIYETPAISQRALSKKFFVSLGKINSTISDLINKNYIAKSDKEGLYSVTKTGENEVKKHRVDGAVILACGKGLRLTKTSDEIPICFIEINGERLIERQIKQLKEAGVTDITIAVGFMKEKFDYLIDKYNVKLVYNDEYKYKNTLSTFHNIKELIRNKNIYICVSDIYMNENLFHNYEIEPYYTGVFRENCKNEWRYISNSKNEIKGVEVGGENDFVLQGTPFSQKNLQRNSYQ